MGLPFRAMLSVLKARAQGFSWRGKRRRPMRPRLDRPIDRERDLDSIPLYYRLRAAGPAHGLRAPASDGALDDRTWADLDLDAVFAQVDRCASAPGQQVLYDRLRRPARTPEPLERFDRLVGALAGLGEGREALRTLLTRLETPAALLLPHLFAARLPEPFRVPWLYPLLTALAAALTVGCLLAPRLLLPLGAILLINALVQLVHRRRVARYVAPLGMVNRLLTVGAELLRLGGEKVREAFPALEADLATLHPLSRRTGWLLRDARAGDDLGAILISYLNAFFLLDLNALSFSLEHLRRHAAALERTFAAVGELDAALSTGWVREGGGWLRPELVEGDAPLELVGLVHPLVQDAVPNTVQLQSSALITGSNMSGKSTFLRAVGVGAVLAQTLHLVTAERYRAPFLTVLTSIGRSDDLLRGKSYYLAEVERIRLLLAADPAAPRLVLIDELFRGTNTVERVAGSCAVLRALAQRPGFVLVATHDLELVHLLGPAYRPFHFRELIEQGAMRFDYLLQEGTSSTRNALAILELLNFPSAVVADARAIADRLGQPGNDGAPPHRDRVTG